MNRLCRMNSQNYTISSELGDINIKSITRASLDIFRFT